MTKPLYLDYSILLLWFLDLNPAYTKIALELRNRYVSREITLLTGPISILRVVEYLKKQSFFKEKDLSEILKSLIDLELVAEGSGPDGLAKALEISYKTGLDLMSSCEVSECIRRDARFITMEEDAFQKARSTVDASLIKDVKI